MNCSAFLKRYYEALCFRLTPTCVKRHYAGLLESMATKFAETLELKENKYPVEIEAPKTITVNTKERVKYFKIALAVKGEGWTEFAQRYGITQPALQRIVAGQSTSKRLNQEIDQFIDRQFKRLGLVVGIQQSNQRAAQNGARFHRAEELGTQL